MMYLLFMQGTIYMAYNGPGIATVADLRASSLSTVIKPKRGSEPETCT